MLTGRALWTPVILSCQWVHDVHYPKVLICLLKTIDDNLEHMQLYVSSYNMAYTEAIAQDNSRAQWTTFISMSKVCNNTPIQRVEKLQECNNLKHMINSTIR